MSGRLTAPAVAGTVLLALSLVPAGSSAGAAASTLGPAQVVAASISAGNRQASVHWVATAAVKGVKTSLVTQAGRASGWQTITETSGTASASVTIILIGTSAYMTGDAAGLYLQGLSQKAAQAEAGQWIALPRSAKIYGPVVAGLTVKSSMQELEMQGKVVRVAAATVHGHRDPGYKGKTKPSPGQPSTTETLYLSPTGAHLPVESIVDGSATVFSNWGSAVNVTKPNGAVTLKPSWLRSA